jgi:hypothetical protein
MGEITYHNEHPKCASCGFFRQYVDMGKEPMPVGGCSFWNTTMGTDKYCYKHTEVNPPKDVDNANS